MSEKTKHCGDKALKKDINGATYYLYKTWDLTYGYGWRCRIYGNEKYHFALGYGFDKTNKFTAVRCARLELFSEYKKTV